MRHPHLTFAEHPMDKLSKNVVPEPVCDSPDPNESRTDNKRYYSATQTDVWATVTYEKDGSSIVNSQTRDTYFSRPSKERKKKKNLFFNCCRHAPRYIQISNYIFSCYKSTDETNKMRLTNLCNIFADVPSHTRMAWAAPRACCHGLRQMPPPPRLRPSLEPSTMGLKPPRPKETSSYNLILFLPTRSIKYYYIHISTRAIAGFGNNITV